MPSGLPTRRYGHPSAAVQVEREEEICYNLFGSVFFSVDGKINN